MNISIEQLYHNCMLSTITHALWARKYPFAKYMHYWDGSNCHFNDLEGNLATISFFKDNNCVVGGIFRKELLEIQSVAEHQNHVEGLLAKLPNQIREFAKKETLQYFIRDIDGIKIPSVSDLFWGHSSDIASEVKIEKWSTIWEKLINIQLMHFDKALLALEKEYDLNEIELQLTLLIFNKKMTDGFKTKINIELDPELMEFLKKDDIDITLDLLMKMNIILNTK